MPDTTPAVKTKAIRVINTSHLKAYALECAGTDFERVSGEFFEEFNQFLLDSVKTHVAALPRQGKTIFGLSRLQKKDTAQVPQPEASAEPVTATEAVIA